MFKIIHLTMWLLGLIVLVVIDAVILSCLRLRRILGGKHVLDDILRRIDRLEIIWLISRTFLSLEINILLVLLASSDRRILICLVLCKVLWSVISWVWGKIGAKLMILRLLCEVLREFVRESIFNNFNWTVGSILIWTQIFYDSSGSSILRHILTPPMLIEVFESCHFSLIDSLGSIISHMIILFRIFCHSWLSWSAWGDWPVRFGSLIFCISITVQLLSISRIICADKRLRSVSLFQGTSTWRVSFDHRLVSFWRKSTRVCFRTHTDKVRVANFVIFAHLISPGGLVISSLLCSNVVK